MVARASTLAVVGQAVLKVHPPVVGGLAWAEHVLAPVGPTPELVLPSVVASCSSCCSESGSCVASFFLTGIASFDATLNVCVPQPEFVIP